MLAILDCLREPTFAAAALRLVLAVLCGGAIGIERAFKRRPAGFRTHILICLGAAMTTLTSQYLYLTLHYYTDMARLGAQVVSGIGFIGAGTIIVTGHNRVKGLTTAAGLWTSAIVGLSIGAGFYEGGIVVTAMVLLSELVFSKLEFRLLDAAPEINLYMEYQDRACLDRVLHLFHSRNVKVLNMQITHSAASEKHNACAIFSLHLPKGCTPKKLTHEVLTTNGVFTVEEL